MEKNFKKSLDHVLIHEGGWADHPQDPGGATMKGITLRTFQRHFGPGKTKDDLRQISDQELEQIYRAGYWARCSCDKLPSGVDYAVFDAVVNSGPGRGAKWLQASVGAKQDGDIGPRTLARVLDQDAVMIVDTLCDRRLAFLQQLSTWATFGRGWERRVQGVRARATDMAGGHGQSIHEMIPAVDFEIVKQGSTGPWVRKLQENLGLHVDGNFDTDTQEALKDWQLAQGLEPDGIAGRNTYRAMGLLP